MFVEGYASNIPVALSKAVGQLIRNKSLSLSLSLYIYLLHVAKPKSIGVLCGRIDVPLDKCAFHLSLNSWARLGRMASYWDTCMLFPFIYIYIYIYIFVSSAARSILHAPVLSRWRTAELLQAHLDLTH